MKKHVGAVGGGMAGSAAHTLLKLGYRVTIIEKDDYIGDPFVEGALTSETGAANLLSECLKNV